MIKMKYLTKWFGSTLF